MSEEDILELRRRVTLIEDDAKGEKAVSRHILRKVTEAEATMLDLRAAMAALRKELTERITAVENQLVTLRADLFSSRISIASVFSACGQGPREMIASYAFTVARSPTKTGGGTSQSRKNRSRQCPGRCF